LDKFYTRAIAVSLQIQAVPKNTQTQNTKMSTPWVYIKSFRKSPNIMYIHKYIYVHTSEDKQYAPH